MTKSFNTRLALTKFAEGLTLIAMVGLTFVSATALATAPIQMVQPVVHQLPTVEITVKKHQLPAVVMTVKRSHTA